MTRPPLSILVLTIFGVGLALLMTVEGLYARLFQVFLSGPGLLDLWLALPRLLASNPLDWALPMVAVGTIWMGGLAALWLGWSWGPWAVRALAIVGLFYLGAGTLLGLAILICLFTPSARRWSQEMQRLHG